MNRYNKKVFRKIIAKWLNIKSGQRNIVNRCTRLIMDIERCFNNEKLEDNERDELARVEREVVRYRFTKNGNQKVDIFDEMIAYSYED